MKCPVCKNKISISEGKGRFVCRYCNTKLEAIVTAHTVLAVICVGLALAALTLYFLGTSFIGMLISAGLISMFYYVLHATAEIRVVDDEQKSTGK